MTKEKLIEKLEGDIKNRLPLLYREKYINDGKQAVVVAEHLLKYDNLFKKIIPISRHSKGKSYFTESHKKRISKEKLFAKSLMGSKMDYLGEIIDFETPLNSARADKAGEIDLVAYNKEKNTLFLIEFKMAFNPETLLRAILEISTYYQQIEMKYFKKDFGYPNAKVSKVILIFKNSPMHKQFKETKCLRELAKKLQVKILVIDMKISEVK